jgi:Scramblase
MTVNLTVMEDLFAVKELRIRQPARMLPGRARFDIFDQSKNLLAVATETEPRSALHTMASLVPRTRILGVRSAAGEPLLTLVKRDDDWITDLKDPVDQLIGQIQIGETRRHYTLLDETGKVAGLAEGDLAVKQFTVSGPEGERFARLRKTWAGLGKELLTSADHYTVTFTGPMPPRVRMLVAMVPIVLDMTRHGPY